MIIIRILIKIFKVKLKLNKLHSNFQENREKGTNVTLYYINKIKILII